jgi:hypothetical protein
MNSRSNNALSRLKLSSVTSCVRQGRSYCLFRYRDHLFRRLPQNGRDQTEISGRDGPKRVVAFSRNGWSRSSEILRTFIRPPSQGCYPPIKSRIRCSICQVKKKIRELILRINKCNRHFQRGSINSRVQEGYEKSTGLFEALFF